MKQVKKQMKRVKKKVHKARCFCCEKTIEFNGPEFSMPRLGATYWRTCGNYGSRVYDSFPCTQIEMYVCDECLSVKLNKVWSVENERLLNKKEIDSMKL